MTEPYQIGMRPDAVFTEDLTGDSPEAAPYAGIFTSPSFVIISRRELRIVDLAEQLAEVGPAKEGDECNFFWGSHGCDLRVDGHSIHRCGNDDPDGPCCEYDEDAEPEVRVRHMEYGVDEVDGVQVVSPLEWGPWGEYPDGWRQ